MYIIKVYNGESLIQTERYSNFQNFICQGSTYRRLLRNIPDRVPFSKVEGFYESSFGSPVIKSEFIFTK